MILTAPYIKDTRELQEFVDYSDFYDNVVQLVSSAKTNPKVVEIGNVSDGYAVRFLRSKFNGSSPEITIIADSISKRTAANCTDHTKYIMAGYDEAANLVDEIDLLHVDAAPHTYETTKKVIDLFLPKVNVAAVFHDASPERGVFRALLELPEEYGFYLADSSKARDKYAAPALVCRGMGRPDVDVEETVRIDYGPRVYGIGDVIFMIPGLEELSKVSGKRVKIDTKYPEIFENNPYIFCGMRYPIAVDTKKANMRLHLSDLQIDTFSYELHVSPTNRVPNIYVTQEEIDGVKLLLPDGPFLVSGLMLENMGWAGRNYPIHHVQELFRLIHDEYGDRLKIVEVGNKQPRSGEADVALVGKISLRQYFAVASLCTFYIGVDTMPTHVARAFNKPSLLLYGGIYPQSRVPEGDCVTFLRADELDCIGCYNDPKNGKRRQKCDKGEKCMEVLTPNRVFAILKPLVDSALGDLHG